MATMNGEEGTSSEVQHLRDVDEARRRLLGHVAHDLAGSLTPLRLWIEMMREDARPDPAALDGLRRNLDLLARLVQDVTDLAAAEFGGIRIAPAPHDLAQLVKQMVHSLQPAARKANVALLCDAEDPCRLEGDRLRLAQVLQNLIGNALKFTPEGGTVRVHASARDGRVHVSVRDTGPGLSADEAAGLFRPFAQVPGTAGGRKGSGLGLFISKRIVEAHGGRIWVESQGHGHGCTFAFAVPAMAGSPTLAPQPSIKDNPGTPEAHAFVVQGEHHIVPRLRT